MHPIIALWSHPRSMSTATERLMRERGDLTCFHEPYMYYYYVERAVRVMPLFDVDPEKPKSYEAIRDMLLEAGEARPVWEGATQHGSAMRPHPLPKQAIARPPSSAIPPTAATAS